MYKIVYLFTKTKGDALKCMKLYIGLQRGCSLVYEIIFLLTNTRRCSLVYEIIYLLPNTMRCSLVCEIV